LPRWTKRWRQHRARWTVSTLRGPRRGAYLTEQRGDLIAPGWLRALLKRRGYAAGRPKHMLQHLQDADAKTAFAAVLAAVGK
jgi:hypothetical protein